MAAPSPPVRSPKPASGTGRLPIWNALFAALTVVGVLFAGFMAIEMTSTVTDTAPVVEVATSDGPGLLEVVALTQEQFENSKDRGAVIRLENSSDHPQNVAVKLNSTNTHYGATITTVLTTAGTKSESGALNTVKLTDITVPAGSVVPVQVELSGSDETFAQFWSEHDVLVVAVAPLAG